MKKQEKIRKNIIVVTNPICYYTAIEVGMVFFWGKSHLDVDGMGWLSIKIAFIILTIVKARYIVMSFMHLGDERKGLKYTILVPYAIFILYLLFILYQESTFIDYVKGLMGWV
ncbi:MAG: cytochrome C oxidase subunit IV family protein [Flavobacteriales bacterium]